LGRRGRRAGCGAILQAVSERYDATKCPPTFNAPQSVRNAPTSLLDAKSMYALWPGKLEMIRLLE
jgi:hypothetical protein